MNVVVLGHFDVYRELLFVANLCSSGCLLQLLQTHGQNDSARSLSSSFSTPCMHALTVLHPCPLGAHMLTLFTCKLVVVCACMAVFVSCSLSVVVLAGL